MENHEGCSQEVVASLDGVVWMPMGSTLTHVEAARRYALQELVPRFDSDAVSVNVYTKWIDGETVFKHQAKVGVCCEVVPLREND